jgi:ribosomal protein S18 acetylase RimI-like enzyme
LRVRTARDRDLPVIGDLWEEMTQLHVELDKRFSRLGDDRASFVEYVRLNLRNYDVRIIVAEQDDYVLGFAIGVLHTTRSGTPELVTGHISDLCVTAKARRMGIGTTLLQSLQSWFKSSGAKTVTANVACANPVSQAFWRSQGFIDFMDRLWCELDESP